MREVSGQIAAGCRPYLRGADVGVVDDEAAVVCEGDASGGGAYMRQKRRVGARATYATMGSLDMPCRTVRTAPAMYLRGAGSAGGAARVASRTDGLFSGVGLYGTPCRGLGLGLGLRAGAGGHGEALDGEKVLKELGVFPLHGWVCLVGPAGGRTGLINALGEMHRDRREERSDALLVDMDGA